MYFVIVYNEVSSMIESVLVCMHGSAVGTIDSEPERRIPLKALLYIHLKCYNVLAIRAVHSWGSRMFMICLCAPINKLSCMLIS